MLSTNPDSTYLSLILTYQYDNNFNLINYYYEDVIDSNIFDTYKSEEPFCWCCDLDDNMLRITYGCEVIPGDGDNDSNDNSGNNYDNSGKTFKGSDNKYYFVSAIKLFRWLLGTFGQPDISLNNSQIGINGENFLLQANGQKGIYILIPNYPALFGASGHVDIFDSTNFDGHGYFNASGGVHSANLWILN